MSKESDQPKLFSPFVSFANKQTQILHPETKALST